MKNKKLMIIGGGTGGHIFPGLEIAHSLLKEGWKIRWLGIANKIETFLVPDNKIEIDIIVPYQFNLKNKKKFLSIPVKMYSCFKQALFFIKKFNPNIVLGMGSYISGIGCLAAWKYKIPIIIHEQNTISGFSNRCIQYIATKKLQAFSGALNNAEVVGNPIRKNILSIPIPAIRLNQRTGLIRILVTGGSQGSWILNKVIPKLAYFIGNYILIWHQTGFSEKNKVIESYKKINYQYYKVESFIKNISKAYKWADIIICRSGALTVSEISSVGIPAIFVPFEHKDLHQYHNAMILKKINAAEILEQKNFTAENIVKILNFWNRIKLKKMAEKATSISIKNSTEKIVKIIHTIIKNNHTF